MTATIQKVLKEDADGSSTYQLTIMAATPQEAIAMLHTVEMVEAGMEAAEDMRRAIQIANDEPAD